MALEAFFLPGRRFALHHAPAVAARGLVVFVHPFAEEMNKSRRMAALQASALAEAGHAVLQIDLLGCGDSDGDFADATWDAWLDDVHAACDWLQQRHGGASPTARPLWLWGLRTGCLLASQIAAKRSDVHGLLLWQPQAAGQTVLQQFLRLKTAATLLTGEARISTNTLRQQLDAGQMIDISGYRLSPALAQGLAVATLVPPDVRSHVLWLEVQASPTPALLPSSTVTIERWRQAGTDVQSLAVSGPAFWQTVEIEVAPALVAASTAALVTGGPWPMSARGEAVQA